MVHVTGGVTEESERTRGRERDEKVSESVVRKIVIK